jgi:hypothetical protein
MADSDCRGHRVTQDAGHQFKDWRCLAIFTIPLCKKIGITLLLQPLACIPGISMAMGCRNLPAERLQAQYALPACI